VSIAAAIRAIPGVRSLGLTTNGYRLAELAEPLRDAGIQALNVSLDSLCRDRFARIARRDALPAVQSGLERALALGFESVKVNVVVIAGVNDDEIPAFAELARDRDITVRFIEYMPFRGNGWEAGGLYPRDRMLSDLAERYSLTPIRFSERSVADVYSVDGFRGRVGFIASMTHSFCGDCSRVRLTADGRIKSCLFSPAEADLRDAMRRGAADDEIEARIRAALLAKRWEHPPAEALRQAENRSMVEIGG
jgi:cyclic pyranopterin phosphate synthase